MRGYCDWSRVKISLVEGRGTNHRWHPCSALKFKELHCGLALDLRFTNFTNSYLRQPKPTRNHKPGSLTWVQMGLVCPVLVAAW